MRRLARLVAGAELPVILAIAPALMFPTPELLTVLAVVPFIWLCAWIGGGRFIPRTPMNTALGLLLAMVGVSLYATFDIRFSLGKVSGTVLGVLLFWAIARWLTTSGRLKVALAAFLLVGTGLAIVGSAGVEVGPTALWLAQAAERWASPLRSAVMTLVDRVNEQAPGVNPNPVAGCLVLFVPLQVVLLVIRLRSWPHARWHHRLTALIQATMLLITAATVWLMHSRGAWLGLAAATSVFLIWRSHPVRMLAAGAAGIILVLAAALGPQGLYDKVNARFNLDLTSAILIREDVWSSGISGVQDSPLTGLGMNTFREIAPTQYPLSYLQPRFPTYNPELVHAHNNLIQAAWDLGIPGLVAYVSLWMISALLLIRVCRHSNERIYQAIAGGLGAGLVAHFIFGITDAIPLGAKVGASFWLALALVVGLHRVALNPEMNVVSQVRAKRAG